jgi:hypothetical protein
LIIPALPNEKFKAEFNRVFQELIDSQHSILDIKYQMSVFYDSKFDSYEDMYSVLILYLEPEPKKEEIVE